MNTNEKTFTSAQRPIVAELCETHGLEASQISFDGDSIVPIFDYEAVSALSLKLTDIQTLDCEITNRNQKHRTTAVASCTTILPDGRTRIVEDSAAIGEIVAGKTLTTIREADGVAQNRASRRGIRSVGINLWNAHKAFVASGKPQAGTFDEDPRILQVKEIHKIADNLGYSREEYEQLIASGYDGRTSTSDLNDIERQNFLRLLRSLERIHNAKQKAADETTKVAA